MSDNFLSFVGKVGQSSIDKGAEKSPLPAIDSDQITEFKRIFSTESVSPKGESLAKDLVQGENKGAPAAGLDEFQGPVSDSVIAPVGLPIASDDGNFLPKLSIYSPGLQVGRVILTTPRPKVSEDSLTAFARAQGINESVLKQRLTSEPQVLGPQTSEPKGLGPQTSEPKGLGPQGFPQQVALEQVVGQRDGGEFAAVIGSNTETASSILSGLLSKSALQSKLVEGNFGKPSPDELSQAERPTKSADITLSALRAQQAFGLAKSDAKAGVSRLGSGELVNPMASTMIGAHDLRAQRQQVIRDGYSAEANKEFTEKEGDGLGKGIDAKILSEKLSISELSLARQAIDSAMEFARSNVQNSKESMTAPVAGESSFSGSTTLSAPPVSALQGATMSVSPVATSLGAVLSANDPSLMQARMQPYQDWAEKFGEVLGQKLSLAVKQGTWAVKLNLNPHSLGEVAISLEVSEKGIEGQLSANDGAVRQLMSDALPKLRASLEDLFGQSGNVNIEVGDDDASKDNQSSGDMVEIAIDLEDEIFNGSKVMSGSGITLRDGFDVLV